MYASISVVCLFVCVNKQIKKDLSFSSSAGRQSSLKYAKAAAHSQLKAAAAAAAVN
jgi:hypothetical protein